MTIVSLMHNGLSSFGRERSGVLQLRQM
ncbi:hypothetical protein NMA58_27535 (plasmid) [Rhizobium sp. YTUHZ045]